MSRCMANAAAFWVPDAQWWAKAIAAGVDTSHNPHQPTLLTAATTVPSQPDSHSLFADVVDLMMGRITAAPPQSDGHPFIWQLIWSVFVVAYPILVIVTSAIIVAVLVLSWRRFQQERLLQQLAQISLPRYDHILTPASPTTAATAAAAGTTKSSTTGPVSSASLAPSRPIEGSRRVSFETDRDGRAASQGNPSTRSSQLTRNSSARFGSSATNASSSPLAAFAGLFPSSKSKSALPASAEMLASTMPSPPPSATLPPSSSSASASNSTASSSQAAGEAISLSAHSSGASSAPLPASAAALTQNSRKISLISEATTAASAPFVFLQQQIHHIRKSTGRRLSGMSKTRKRAASDVGELLGAGRSASLPVSRNGQPDGSFDLPRSSSHDLLSDSGTQATTTSSGAASEDDNLLSSSDALGEDDEAGGESAFSPAQVPRNGSADWVVLDEQSRTIPSPTAQETGNPNPALRKKKSVKRKISKLSSKLTQSVLHPFRPKGHSSFSSSASASQIHASSSTSTFETTRA
ncbi:hypothetical protein CAOG_05852 [Capsaspora owczarzaki ATCC 30864]|uniref:Uncharacterized protein n=1 Tax=Capsaspora owczarzaki (strain ATCC 30864) TaxID=595528 RepID=A0A0D2WU60_CAPO3|nr:hypothetical protein CAOG_05852 [Capsaspora owczarzaki ATCC 30864]KJE95398.1 hypothetical protein CAOG_005852 [Capsaspora owczarzaki ATCC 30864]|eukprot:XP_004345442.2 hypothetical protein CAOG_05852 [Capsaspora owczarzaki ATCC 30864]